MTDMRGQEFEVGDVVAVAARRGSASWIELRVVKRVENEHPWLKKWPETVSDKSKRYGGTSRAILVVNAMEA